MQGAGSGPRADLPGPRSGKRPGRPAAGRSVGRVRELALVTGVVVGLLLSSLGLGLPPTYGGCATGRVVGWSGPIAVPVALGIPPPGGLVTWSFALTTHDGPWTNTTSGSTRAPVNSTVAVTFEVNWTAVEASPVSPAGAGAGAACPSIRLVPHSLGPTCLGCPVAPSAPAGLGQRSAVPPQFTVGSVPSVSLNATYPADPFASFSWSAAGANLSVRDDGNFSGYLPSVAAVFVDGSFVGLGLSVRVSALSYGVPIRLMNGTYTTVGTSTPGGFPGASFDLNVTYIFPADRDQGRWNVYFAGEGSPYPLGGLLFERVA